VRYAVQGVLVVLSAGLSVDELLADYSDLERGDVLGSGRRRAGTALVSVTWVCS